MGGVKEFIDRIADALVTRDGIQAPVPEQAPLSCHVSTLFGEGQDSDRGRPALTAGLHAAPRGLCCFDFLSRLSTMSSYCQGGGSCNPSSRAYVLLVVSRFILGIVSCSMITSSPSVASSMSC